MRAHVVSSTTTGLTNNIMKGSPTTRFPGRLPKGIQRALPVYLFFILVVVFFWTVESVSSFKLSVVWERVRAYQLNPGVTTTIFPKKIWQTWKIDPLEFEERDSTRARSWTRLNPGYRYEVLTDGNDLHYVETNFGPAGLNRPDIVYFYKSLTAKIIKADLLRYLILYNEGGVYADIDVEALQPVDNFIPPHFDKADVDLVISIEIDEPTYANHTILGPKSQSFCQWTIMSKPRSPAILRIINNVINWLTDVARKQDVHVSEIKLNFDDVLSGTGPSAFTIAIIDEMKAQTGRKTIDWVPMFHNMSEPKLVGRTLVLTVESFAAGQGHSNSGNHDSPKALVKHHYHASKWPDRHPRYSHPGYGMVEECNWNPDCVAAWDNNTALYPTLSEEEKAKVLEEKKKYDEERFHGEEEDRINREREDAERRDRDMREQCAKLDPPFAPLPPPEPQHNGGENHEGENHEEQKPAEDKPAEEKPKEDKPIEEKPPEEKPSEQKPEGEKPRDGKDVEPPHVAPIKPEKETKTNT